MFITNGSNDVLIDTHNHLPTVYPSRSPMTSAPVIVVEEETSARVTNAPITSSPVTPVTSAPSLVIVEETDAPVTSSPITSSPVTSAPSPNLSVPETNEAEDEEAIKTRSSSSASNLYSR